jgi:hypothetical protein
MQGQLYPLHAKLSSNQIYEHDSLAVTKALFLLRNSYFAFYETSPPSSPEKGEW